MNMTEKAVPIDGQFDPSFGEAGKVLLDKVDPKGVLLNPNTCKTDSAGRIYIAGALGDWPNYKNYFCLRLTPEGVVDPVFGDKGYSSGSFYNDDNHDKNLMGCNINILADNKILLTGYLYNPPTLQGLARLNADGSLDLSFGEAGKVVIDFADKDAMDASSPRSTKDQQASGTLVLADGKIMLWQHMWHPEESYTVVARLHENGAIDTNFNQTGFVKIPNIANFRYTYVQGISLENDGAYTLTCACSRASDRNVVMFTRLLPDGRTDMSFADSGYLIIRDQDFSLEIKGAVRQTNNRLLAFGAAFQNSELSGLLISREADGSQNIQFNQGLPLVTHFGARKMAWSGAFIQNNGNILVHGYFEEKPGVTKTVAARFTDAGVLDPGFGAGTGGLTFGIQPASVAWLTDNKILILGYKTDGSINDLYIARRLLG